MELEALGIDLTKDDVLHNLVIRKSQFIKGTSSCRWSKEKDALLMLLIEFTTLVGDVVLDYTIATSIVTFLHLLNFY